jgi:AcrR family transcriptional regulator
MKDRMPTTRKSDRTEKRPRDREVTRRLLIEAVGKTLAGQGFARLGVNAVAQEAGVDKVLVYRYFGGMQGLITAFGQEGDFWPSIEELAGGDIESFRQLPLANKLCALGRNFLTGIRKRPLTQEIMAWEMVERNDLTVELDTIRETRMLRFAEMFLPPDGRGIDLMAISAVIGAGISYLVCRSRTVRWYNGINLTDDEGWKRIEQGIEQIVKGTVMLL